MSENTQVQSSETKLVEVKLEIAEPFVNFLKDYLAFFGSGMTVEDLMGQMVYSETRFLCGELATFANGKTVYVGKLRFFKKYQYIANTLGEWPLGLADVEIVPESKELNTCDLLVDHETYNDLKAYADTKGLTVEKYLEKFVKNNDLSEAKLE